MHIARESGVATELSLFIGQPASGTGIKIIDVTPAVPRREYSGSDFSAALSDFNSGNSYPEGLIQLRVPQNSLGVAAQGWNIQTSGASLAQRLSSGWGWASLGLAGLGVLAAIIPGAQPLAPAFFLASGALGAASAGASLYQRSQEAQPSGVGIAIDIASLVGSVLGMAGAANILRHGPRIAAATRTGRFVLYTGFASDAIGGVFILAEGAEQIAQILDGPGTADDKAAAVARIFAGLLLNGTLLAFGARDVRATRRQLTSVLSAGVLDGLSTTDIHMLSLLEGPAMARLSSASLEEVQSIAVLIRQDPVRAGALVSQFGESFVTGARARPENLEELAQALHAGAPEVGGTRGTFGPAPGIGPRPVYLQVDGQSSPLSLAARVRQVFLSVASPTRIALAEGASLRAVGGGTPPQTRYELVIPASGARPQIVVPVRIESVPAGPLTSVHGPETGPARLEVRSSVNNSGARSYEADIEVRADLARADIGYAVGHELDEVVGIAIAGVSGNAITAQKRASLMRAQAPVLGAPVPPVTAHDHAAAREFSNFVSQNVPVAQRPADFAMPPDVTARALSLGFGGPAHLENKLGLLRAAGVDEDMIGRLRVMALGPSVAAALPVGSPFAAPGLLGHLLAREPSALPQSPIGGLHLESALDATRRGFVDRNEGLHVVRTADSSRTQGPVTYNAYEQWVWTGAPPPGPRPTAAGTPSPVGKWELRNLPKTTFDNLPAFLAEAEGAWAAWRAANPTAAGANVQWRQASPGGQMIEGWVDLTVTPIRMRSVYPYRVGGLGAW
jgi:hypothetical protein